jgi:hypothetical protein
MVQLTLHWIINYDDDLSIGALCEAISIKRGEKALAQGLSTTKMTFFPTTVAWLDVALMIAKLNWHTSLSKNSSPRSRKLRRFRHTQSGREDGYPTLANICLAYITLDDLKLLWWSILMIGRSSNVNFPFENMLFAVGKNTSKALGRTRRKCRHCTVTVVPWPHGCSLSIDAQGLTAGIYAQRSRNQEILALLREYKSGSGKPTEFINLYSQQGSLNSHWS